MRVSYILFYLFVREIRLCLCVLCKGRNCYIVEKQLHGNFVSDAQIEHMQCNDKISRQNNNNEKNEKYIATTHRECNEVESTQKCYNKQSNWMQKWVYIPIIIKEISNVTLKREMNENIT